MTGDFVLEMSIFPFYEYGQFSRSGCIFYHQGVNYHNGSQIQSQTHYGSYKMKQQNNLFP